MEQKNPANLVLGLVIGLVIGVVVSGVWTNKLARKGWNLAPVVVAMEDLPAGTVLTFDHISQRSVPEQFVTRSVVRPENAEFVIHQKLKVPVMAGDLILWSHLETSEKKPAPEAQPMATGHSAQ